MTQEFVERCVATAADLALLFVGTPEPDMMMALFQVRSNLEAQLAELFGPEVAAQIAEAFVAAVQGRRRELMAGARGTA